MTNSLHQSPLDAEILSRTPPEMIELTFSLLDSIYVLEVRVEYPEVKLNESSPVPNRHPSSDSPFSNRPDKKPHKHKVMCQQYLRPTGSVELHLDRCACGCRVTGESKPHYLHQAIDLPEIEANISHIILYQRLCSSCEKNFKAPHISYEQHPGVGSRI